MKKVLSVLSLIAVLGLTSPAFAGPHGGPGGPGGHGPHGGGGHRIHAGAHHRPQMAPRHHHHHGGVRVYTGHYPRHSYWYGYRAGYWGSPWCDYRLGCYPYHYPGFGVHIPMGGASFAVHF